MGESKRGAGGGKLSRSEVVTVRLDPRLRYLAELAGRKQRRTLSSLVEWAIEDALARIRLGDLTIDQEADRLWDIDPAERLIRLAVLHPELLNYEEQLVWKMLSDSLLLAPAYDSNTGWDWETLTVNVFPTIRNYWPDLMIAAAGSPSEQRQFVERTRSEVASGKVYQDEILTVVRPSTNTPHKGRSSDKDH